jgi:hypothetical protein
MQPAFLFFAGMVRKLPLMKRSMILACLVFGLGISAFAQKARVPTFGQYHATVEKATAKSIDFRRSPDAWSFRTRLKEALRGGVNFAGRYIIAGWGCGTGCISGGIIDARTGRVYFPEPLGGLGAGTADDDEGYVEQPVRYQKNSRLLIITGVPAIQIEGKELPMGEYFYEWRNNRLRLIHSIPRKNN